MPNLQQGQATRGSTCERPGATCTCTCNLAGFVCVTSAGHKMTNLPTSTNRVTSAGHKKPTLQGSVFTSAPCCVTHRWCIHRWCVWLCTPLRSTQTLYWPHASSVWLTHTISHAKYPPPPANFAGIFNITVVAVVAANTIPSCRGHNLYVIQYALSRPPTTLRVPFHWHQGARARIAVGARAATSTAVLYYHLMAGANAPTWSTQHAAASDTCQNSRAQG